MENKDTELKVIAKELSKINENLENLCKILNKKSDMEEDSLQEIAHQIRRIG